jgi:hypothetical protein
MPFIRFLNSNTKGKKFTALDIFVAGVRPQHVPISHLKRMDKSWPQSWFEPKSLRAMRWLQHGNREMVGLTQIRFVKILCLAVLLGIVISSTANGSVPTCKGTTNRPIVILGLSKIT